MLLNKNLNWPALSLNGQVFGTLALSGGSALYAVLFWTGQMGLNTLIFAGFLTTLTWILHPEYRAAPRIWAAMLGVLLSAVAVFWQHSNLAKVAHLVSIFLLLGFAQARELRFLGYALLLAATSVFSMPLTWWRRWEKEYEVTLRWLGNWTYLALLPLSLLGLFFCIYYYANVEFARLVDWLIQYWPRFSPWKTLALLLQGALLISVLLWPSVWTAELQQQEQEWSLWKLRKRVKEKLFSPTLALRQHYYSALLSFGLLNALLLVVNLSDIKAVWLNPHQYSATELSSSVHQGTYLLIVALGLAMALIAYFFQGNLHFLPNNRNLKILAYTWIIQNTVLALSVAWRNYHYIVEYGMAYKRLGVLWFLVLVILGLYSLYIMVQERRSLYYLWVLNAWFLYLSLLGNSFINWDVFITRYNLQQARHKTIDTHFLLKDISDKNLPTLLNEHSLLLQRSDLLPEDVDRMLNKKIKDFEGRQRKMDWRGWNYADWRTAAAL
jgi:hypothetical protein